jgi:acyl-homoserine-lactone acylase
MQAHRLGPVLALALLVAACGGGGSDDNRSTGGGNPGGSSGTYDATVVRTRFGIPHISARDFGSLGYGYGYAFAEDNLCTMLDDYVTVRGERARYFGRDGSYSIPAVPVTANNVDSDFFWKLLADNTAVARFKAGAAPEVQQASRGYVAGFNRYIGELKAGQHPGRHVACAGKPWLQNITEDDMYRRFLRLAVIASGSALTTEIATAQPPLIPPTASAARGTAQDALNNAALARLSPDAEPFARLREHRFGSNMYALGKQASATGQPIVFGNPHFPWTGTERLYLAHLTIPGRLDIMGVGLYGVPLALIGFNDKLAWSHTVSTAY